MPRKLGNVLLNVNGRYFQVDRKLLIAQSIYFRTLFRNPTKRDRHGAYLVPGNADRFGLILDYLTGDHHLSIDQLESIINDGATLYLIPSLVYLAQFKAEYAARDRQRMEEVKRAIMRTNQLKKEITNLEFFIDKMRQKNY